jgi:hypothetical protein
LFTKARVRSNICNCCSHNGKSSITLTALHDNGFMHRDALHLLSRSPVACDDGIPCMSRLGLLAGLGS